MKSGAAMMFAAMLCVAPTNAALPPQGHIDMEVEHLRDQDQPAYIVKHSTPFEVWDTQREMQSAKLAKPVENVRSREWRTPVDARIVYNYRYVPPPPAASWSNHDRVRRAILAYEAMTPEQRKTASASYEPKISGVPYVPSWEHAQKSSRH